MGNVERCDKTLALNEMIFYVRRDARLRERWKTDLEGLARDVHVGGALEDEDRLFLLRVGVHHGGLTGLVAGDLRPELVGLEEHLAHALVGGESLQGVQIENLRHTSHARGCRLVHSSGS